MRAPRTQCWLYFQQLQELRPPSSDLAVYQPHARWVVRMKKRPVLASGHPVQARARERSGAPRRTAMDFAIPNAPPADHGAIRSAEPRAVSLQDYESLTRARAEFVDFLLAGAVPGPGDPQ